MTEMLFWLSFEETMAKSLSLSTKSEEPFGMVNQQQ